MVVPAATLNAAHSSHLGKLSEAQIEQPPSQSSHNINYPTLKAVFLILISLKCCQQLFTQAAQCDVAMAMARPSHENKRHRAVLQILRVGFAPAMQCLDSQNVVYHMHE